MATTSLWPIKKTINNTIEYVENKDKTQIPISDLSNTIDYASNKNKTEEQFYVTGINCDSNSVYQDMMLVKKAYNKIDNIQGFHGYQSFKEGEVTPDVAHKIGIQLANEMWGDEFQVVVTTHLNTNHVHNHFVVNSVSMKDGHKYNYSNHEMARLRQTNDFICKEYGLSSLEEKVTRKNFDFSKYMNHDNYSVRTQRDIDIAIKNSFNYQDFINTMKKMNYEVIERYGKLSVKHANMKRNIRIERQFGEDYSIDNIYRRITEEVPDKLTTEELTTYNYHKNKYYKNKHSLGAMFLYFIFRIKTYEKSPRNYPISEEMKKEINKMELYNLEVRFMDENKIDTLDELSVFSEVNKDFLNDMISLRKKSYELKSKTDDKSLKDEYTSLNNYYNEVIKDLQSKIKTCEIIKKHNKQIYKELNKIDITKDKIIAR